MESAAQIYAKHIRAMLRGGPAKALTLAEGLRVSQPTISRTIKALGDEVISVALQEPSSTCCETMHAPISNARLQGQ